jgi:hypothetical protein
MYTNAVATDDAYRAPLLAETSTYELIQAAPAANIASITNLFGFGESLAAIEATSGTHDIAFEDLHPALNGDKPYRRLIARTRTLYRPDEMGAAAGDPLALLLLTQAFTPRLVAQVHQRNGSALMPAPAAVRGNLAADGGGYVDLDGDGAFWLHSGRRFSADDTRSAAHKHKVVSTIQQRSQARLNGMPRIVGSIRSQNATEKHMATKGIKPRRIARSGGFLTGTIH